MKNTKKQNSAEFLFILDQQEKSQPLDFFAWTQLSKLEVLELKHKIFAECIELNKKTPLQVDLKNKYPTLPEMVAHLDRLYKQAKAEPSPKPSEEMRLQIRKANEEAAKAWIKDMQTWIDKNGSAGLKAAKALDFDIQGSYVRERAAHELPGWDVQTRHRSINHTAAAARRNPSALAIDVLNYVVKEQNIDPQEVSLVWQTSLDVGESLAVENYLGRYPAFLSIAEIREDFLLFLAHLSQFLTSGASVTGAMKALTKTASQPYVQKKLTMVLNDIQNGSSVSQAFENNTQLLAPASAWALLKEMEQSGIVSRGLPMVRDMIIRYYSFEGKRQSIEHLL